MILREVVSYILMLGILGAFNIFHLDISLVYSTLGEQSLFGSTPNELAWVERVL
jgi:hypothetical protein